MSFTERGFLSDKPISWSKESHPEFDEWFNLVETLNCLAMKAMLEARPSNTNEHLLTAVLFGRTLQSFQAAILLAKRGILTDAKTLIRSAAESTIAMGGICETPSFLDKLIEDHFKHSQAIANSLLNCPESYATMTPEQISGLQKLLADIKAQYPNQKLAKINWEEIANKSGLQALYITVYRDLSANGAHATINSLNSHVKSNSEGEIEALSFAPKTDGLIDTLSCAINTILFAGFFYTNTFKLSNLEPEWRYCLSKWQELSKN